MVIDTKTREQVIDMLSSLYEKGYRYVVRDKNSKYLLCYSLKPKRYRDLGIWGYVNPEMDEALMSYPIKNEDMDEINWNNRSAKLIIDIISTKRNKEVSGDSV